MLYIEAMFLSLRLWSSLLLAPVALFKFVLLFWFVCSDMCVVLFVCIFVLGYQMQVLFGLNFHSFFFMSICLVSVFWTQACPEGMCTNGTQVPCEVPSLPNPTTQLF